MDEQRLDKWLWCARFFKTRRNAGDGVKSGRVTVNGQRAKPARGVRIGDTVRVQRPPYEFYVEIIGLAPQRVSADRTGELYRESPASRLQRETLSHSITAAAIIDDRRGKPTKKQRRERKRMKRSL